MIAFDQCTLLNQSPRQWPDTKVRDVLVRDELHHHSDGENGFVLHVVCGKGQRCPQVLLGKMRVGVEHIRERATRAQFCAGSVPQ